MSRNVASVNQGDVCLLGLYDTVMQAIVQATKHRKPEMRVAQAKPMTGIRRWSKMGNTMPPAALPPRTIPIAVARLRRNQ